MINGFVCIAEGNITYGAKRGDIFIWWIKGQSSGNNGHTGIFLEVVELLVWLLMALLLNHTMMHGHRIIDLILTYIV